MAALMGRRVARALLTLGGLGCLLWWAAGSPRQAVLAVLAVLAALRDKPTQFDQLLADVAGAAAWICLCWFCAVVALQLFALGSGALSRACQWSADRIAPRFMLGGARWLVGMTMLAGPLTSGVATAAQVNNPTPPRSPVAVLSLDRPVLPNLDRPLASSFADVDADAARATTSPARPADQPPAIQTAAAPAVSSPQTAEAPRSPTSQPPARSPALAAPILTGAPHRETAAVGATYVVRAGDTLWDIAARHLGEHPSAADIARAWPRWYLANQAAIGPNPQLIHPGLALHAPID
jgi:hypothetical protein